MSQSLYLKLKVPGILIKHFLKHLKLFLIFFKIALQFIFFVFVDQNIVLMFIFFYPLKLILKFFILSERLF
jgi:hypothetical protein